jgi:hypothetical protein
MFIASGGGISKSRGKAKGSDEIRQAGRIFNFETGRHCS